MKKLSFLMIAALVMAACSNNDELLNNENLNGKVTVTATLPSDVPDSRVALTEATDDNSNPIIKVSWEDTESFSVIRGTENKTYSKSTEGNAFTGDAHATADGIYYAFYPANETATATNALPYDLSVQTGALAAEKTYMYAKNETDGKNYEFGHLTALVMFTLALPDDATGVTPSKVVISSDKLKPVGTVDLTGDAVAYTQTENTATSITITPNEGEASLTFYAYVTPMSASESDKNTFVVSMDGSDGKYYSGTLETSVSIAANYLYTASVNMICVAKGDLAMKNGSFMKYATDMTLTDAQKANVAGIVFWTTADMNTAQDAQTPAKLTDDKIMATDFPNCTHGLIVSLKDVSQSTKWQSTYSNIASWQDSGFNADDKDDYKSIASGTGATDPINYILGYQNTKVLKAYNEQCEEAHEVLPVSLLETFSDNNPAPANTTGWFIPSAKELTLLCGKDVDNIWANNSGGTDTKTTMNTILTSLGTNYADTFGNNYYWSSSEFADYESSAFYVYFYDGLVDLNYKDVNAVYVRAVCAY